jgi:hypothetical protein
MRSPALLLVALSAFALAGMAAAAPTTLVVCAPGYPGTTAEAQPTLDLFASAAARAAGWGAGELTAVYHEEESAGLARLRGADAALALVPLPFYLEHRGELALAPLAQAVAQGGAANESWTLVAGKGKVAAPGALAGFELVSLAAYSPRFVRLALASWGGVPAGVSMKASGALLSGLRRAAAGEKVALLLDRAQAAALPGLPFAAQLETVATSPALPVSVLATVGDRLPAARARPFAQALLSLGGTPEGAAALAALRLDRFVAADAPALAAAERDFARLAP